jgi:thermostable 8-oxoguanine DNA glycosylase
MQTMYSVHAGTTYLRNMPTPETTLRSGLCWGRFDELFSAAYWCGQAWQADLHGHYRQIRLGESLAEETAACLLGGYGMPAELGLAAYDRLRGLGLLLGTPSASVIERNLEQPFVLSGRSVRYRFPRQKASYLASCLRDISELREDELDDLHLREQLTRMAGIGLKTASWIVRNRRRSTSVAVIDVHVLKAGRLLGLFEEHEVPQRDYLSLESRFVDLAEEIDAPAWLLDAVIWQHMRLLRGA